MFKKRVRAGRPLLGADLKLSFKCFGVSLGLMALIYLCIGVPFFGNSVLVLDLNGQYVYFFEALHNIIYDRDASLLYSFSRAMGGEFMGIFAYYLASPFSFLVALLPSAIITESLYVMILLKVGLAGATMGWYLQKTYPGKERNVLFFSAMYALCAWSLTYGNNVMWLDTFLLFPLVIRGADLLLSGKNWLFYTLMLGLTLLTHFYMGYMVCLFLILYFFYFHLFRRGEEEYNPTGRKAHFLRSGLSFAGCSLLAVALAAVILLPAAYSLTLGKNTFTDPTYEFSFKLTFLDIIYKLFPFSVDTVRREGLPYLYCGTAALVGAFLFFASKKVRIQEKFGAGVFLLTLCLCFSLSVVDIWWHGGQEPNWLNYRYSFMFSFMLLLYGYRGFGEIESASTRKLVTVPCVMGMFLVVLQAFGYGKDYEYTKENFPRSFDYNLFFYFFGFLLLGAVVALLLYFKKNSEDGGNKRKAQRALCFLVFGEILLSGVMSQVGLAYDVGFCGRASYVDFMKQVKPAVEAIQEKDESFYRMDKTFHRQPADAMALNMRSLSVTTSTLNKKTLQFTDRMGYAGGSYWSEYLGGNPVSDMLLDVKYILTKDRTYEDFYERVYTDEENGIYGYRNPYALSLGYAVDEELLSVDLEESFSPMVRINELTAAMTGYRQIQCFRPVALGEGEAFGLSVGRPANHRSYTNQNEKNPGMLTFTFTAESDDLTYLYFPTDYPRDCTLFLDGEEWGEAMGNDSDCILTLGRFEPGSTHTIALQPRNQKFYLRTNQTYLWTLDEEALKSAYTVLSQGNWKILPDFKEDRLEGTVTVPEGCTLLFTSVPYEEGWVVTVDGREVQPVLTERTVQNEKTGEEKTEQTACLDALVAFRITPGVHSVRLEYKPASVFYGGLISLLAVAVLFLMAVLDYGILRPLRRKKRSEKEAPPAVPEGDASESAEPADPTDHAPVEKSVNERPETDKTAGRKKTEAKRGKSPSGKKGKGRR